MRRPYIVALGEGFPRKELLDLFNRDSRFGYWFYSMPNSFIVYSSVDANSLDAFIKANFGEKYRYFISELSISNHQGWMPKEHWSIINNNGFDKVYDLMFKGYFRNESDLPHESGIYCVYRGMFNESTRLVDIRELLYIGSAKDIYQRHLNHENKSEWMRCVSSSEQIWFSCASLDENELERCEATLIFLNKPKCNQIGKESFRYLDTIVNVKGSAILLLKGGAVEKMI